MIDLNNPHVLAAVLSGQDAVLYTSEPAFPQLRHRIRLSNQLFVVETQSKPRAHFRFDSVHKTLADAVEVIEFCRRLSVMTEDELFDEIKHLFP